MIDEDVDALLTSGKAYEKNLLQLESSINTKVAVEREKIKYEVAAGM